MFDEAITPNQRAALSALRPAADLGFYVAGGTGLCLRLAHRRSFDIDLFREDPFDPDQLQDQLQSQGLRFANARTKPNTLWIDVADVRTSFMRFPYPRLGVADPVLGVPIASIEDIAAMKVEAIASRGARKDFYDLYFICRDSGGIPFALSAFERRFASAQPDMMHRLKALTFFDDAENEPEAVLLKPVEWSAVRSYFEREATAYWQTH